MGILRKGVERLENRTKRSSVKKNEKKKRKPDKKGKNEPSVKRTIPSRRGRRKK